MKPSILSLLLCLLLVDLAISLDPDRDCICRIQSMKRIVGGHEADPMSYPWMVSLQKIPDPMRNLSKNETIDLHDCGGVIINEQWILTASHCIFGKSEKNFRVGYGSNDLVELHDRKQYVEIEKFHPHEDIIKNDIGLIKLTTPLKFGKAVQPACLPDHYQDYYGGALQISGFGSVEKFIPSQRKYPEASRYLKEGNTFDFSDAISVKCRMFHVCTMNPWSRDSVCSGDSGGPLHYTKSGRSTVIGITSYGDRYCESVSRFTRVSSHMEWIVNKTAGSELCLPKRSGLFLADTA